MARAVLVAAGDSVLVANGIAVAVAVLIGDGVLAGCVVLVGQGVLVGATEVFVGQGVLVGAAAGGVLVGIIGCGVLVAAVGGLVGAGGTLVGGGLVGAGGTLVGGGFPLTGVRVGMVCAVVGVAGKNNKRKTIDRITVRILLMRVLVVQKSIKIKRCSS